MASLAHYAEVQTIPTYESASILFTTQLCTGAVRTDALHRMMRTIAAFHDVREHRPCRRIAPHAARKARPASCPLTNFSCWHEPGQQESNELWWPRQEATQCKQANSLHLAIAPAYLAEFSPPSCAVHP